MIKFFEMVKDAYDDGLLQDDVESMKPPAIPERKNKSVDKSVENSVEKEANTAKAKVENTAKVEKEENTAKVKVVASSTIPCSDYAEIDESNEKVSRHITELKSAVFFGYVWI